MGINYRIPEGMMGEITSAALSFGIILRISTIDLAFDIRFLSLNMTPLGVPVVPEV